jgi:hypothetical protein
MKLRIRGDSIRLRLTKTDVATLVEKGTVGESMRMAPGASFEYRLTADGAAQDARVSLAGSVLEVRLPRNQIKAWAKSNEVGIETRQKNGSQEGLLVLVEKDFPCLTARPNEDDSDAFDRPNVSL